MWEQGIKAVYGRIIRMPTRNMDRLGRDRLAQRFELYTERA